MKLLKARKATISGVSVEVRQNVEGEGINFQVWTLDNRGEPDEKIGEAYSENEPDDAIRRRAIQRAKENI